MSETATALLTALEELDVLEREFADSPTTERATQMTAVRQVALALGERFEREKQAQAEREAVDKRRQFERELQDVTKRLDELYSKAATGLEQVLDATDEAQGLYHHARRLESFIDKLGGIVDRHERSFWTRHPQLRYRFIDSVLRNGEP